MWNRTESGRDPGSRCTVGAGSQPAADPTSAAAVAARRMRLRMRVSLTPSAKLRASPIMQRRRRCRPWQLDSFKPSLGGVIDQLARVFELWGGHIHVDAPRHGPLEGGAEGPNVLSAELDRNVCLLE